MNETETGYDQGDGERDGYDWNLKWRQGQV